MFHLAFQLDRLGRFSENGGALVIPPVHSMHVTSPYWRATRQKVALNPVYLTGQKAVKQGLYILCDIVNKSCLG